MAHAFGLHTPGLMLKLCVGGEVPPEQFRVCMARLDDSWCARGWTSCESQRAYVTCEQARQRTAEGWAVMKLHQLTINAYML